MHRFCSFFHAQILLVVDEIFVQESLQTRSVAPHKLSIDNFLVIKVIISNDKFIASIYHEKNLGHDLVFLIFTDENLASNKNLV